ncbi:MAG TPA: sodium/glutamate symporter [Steroidobacteraceae bacterium]|nr:sodium/glutamate symporter [Steroidobacteraceae bacterium]
MLKLDLIQTLAFGGLALMLGYALRRWVPAFARYNLPAPVLGGLLVAIILLASRSNSGEMVITFDTTLQSPLMIAFFTTIGFGASLSLLRSGGPQVLIFLAIATVFAIAQNLLGILVAMSFGLHPLFGVLAGSVTLTGGPATGLAFAPLFEQAGVPAAASVAVAVAMAGIVAGGIVGGPIGTMLIERFGLRSNVRPHAEITVTTEVTMDGDTPESPSAEDSGETFAVLKSVVVILLAMWVGSWVSKGFGAIGFTLPAYIGAMLVAAVIRNIDDATGWLGLSTRIIDVIGAVSLALFLALALMTLKLWELATLAGPIVVTIVLQVILVGIAARWLVFRFMGRDYEAAVMSGGFIGFMLGTTANAMAVMSTLVERHGPAPRAFLVAPMVGAFFIDFTNALIITGALNILG